MDFYDAIQQGLMADLLETFPGIECEIVPSDEDADVPDHIFFHRRETGFAGSIVILMSDAMFELFDSAMDDPECDWVTTVEMADRGCFEQLYAAMRSLEELWVRQH